MSRTGFDKSIEFRMHQRVAHQMKANLVRERGDLTQDRFEKLGRHHPFRAYDFGTKAALKIADIADFDVHLGESLLHSLPLA